MSQVLPWPLDADHMLRLYARLAHVSARILECAQAQRWDDLADEQAHLVDITGEMARCVEDDALLTEHQRTSRILYLTAALSDQQAAVDLISRQANFLKADVAAIGRSERLQKAYQSSVESG